MSLPAEGQAPGRAALVMNPRSGGGKVARFALGDVAERLGADVLLTAVDQDAASLARRAVAEGATVLGAAGGDGTVSAVAAVAVDAGLPLLVVPAGTRNHFARDLGLDLRRPAAALAALRGGELLRVDLGSVNDRVFLNNVSLGLYAEALLTPGYREDRARALASVAGPYLEGRQGVEVTVDGPEGRIEHPQVVLVSNNPYHFATPRYTGRRFALDSGALGVIVLKRSPDAPPEPLPRLMRELAEGDAAEERADGFRSWSAPRVVVEGAAQAVAAGVDGEAVPLALPLTCEIRPRALRVLLPTDRPGVPREPAPPRRPRAR